MTRLKTVWHLLLVIVSVCAASPAGAAPPLGIRDIVVGMTGADLTRVLRQNGDYTCSVLSCRQTLQVKGVPVDVVLLLAGSPTSFSDARLHEIRGAFDEHRFPVLRDALVEKYGSPSRSARISFRLATGKNKTRDSHLWFLGSGEISLTNISPDAGDGKGSFAMTGGGAATGF